MRLELDCGWKQGNHLALHLIVGLHHDLKLSPQVVLDMIEKVVHGDQVLCGFPVYVFDGRLCEPEWGETRQARAQMKQCGEDIRMDRIEIDEILRRDAEMGKLPAETVQHSSDRDLLRVAFAGQDRGDDLSDMIPAQPDEFARFAQAVQNGHLNSHGAFPLEVAFIHGDESQDAALGEGFHEDLQKLKLSGQP